MRTLILALIVCLLPPTAVIAAPTAPPTINMPSLTDMLAKNKGNVLVLNFFATWCPPCRAEIPALAKIGREYADRGVRIIGFSVDDDIKSVASFVSQMGMEYPVYMVGSDIAQAYRVSCIPHNALYSKSGNLILSEPGILDAATLKSLIEKLLEH